MILRSGLICAAALVTMGGLAANANAQIIGISNTGYQVAGGGQKSAKPDGTTSIPGAVGAPVTWQVIHDYGTVSQGAFTATPAVHVGAVDFTIIVMPGGGGNYNWSTANREMLVNPPLSFYVRARLQKQTLNGWQTEATAYTSIP